LVIGAASAGNEFRGDLVVRRLIAFSLYDVRPLTRDYGETPRCRSTFGLRGIGHTQEVLTAVQDILNDLLGIPGDGREGAIEVGSEKDALGQILRRATADIPCILSCDKIDGTVFILLERVKHIRTIVAGVSDPIHIRVGLVDVRSLRAVVGAIVY
jgi:hypothetical protein